MPYILVRHKVANYAKWKPVFDEHSATRSDNGSRGGLLFRNADNPSETVLLLEWDNLEKARRFVQSEDLRQAMQKAGVVDQPDVYFLEEAEKVSR